MDTTFMNSGDSKTSDTRRILLSLSNKINKNKRRSKYVALSILSIYYTQKNIKEIQKRLKYQLWHGMKSMNYMMDHILYQIFKNILSISSKNMRELPIIAQ